MKKNILITLVLISILTSCARDTAPESSPQKTPQTDSESFSIIVLPDTQNAVQNFPEVFMKQIQWIAKNKEKLNIQAVIHVGDQVNKANDEKQWKTFDQGIKILDAINMPVLLALGNHDHPSTLYDRYFPIARYSAQKWWGGQMGNDTDNKYILLNLAGKDFIFINVDYCPTKEEIQWSNEVLTRHPDHRALLVTHAYLDKNAGRNPHICKDTNYIWNDLIKLHKNLTLVVSGHVHAESRRTDKNIAGNDVYQMLADFQEEDYGGNGWLRILTFSPYNDMAEVTTYSPFLDKYQDDSESKFVLEYTL